MGQFETFHSWGQRHRQFNINLEAMEAYNWVQIDIYHDTSKIVFYFYLIKLCANIKSHWTFSWILVSKFMNMKQKIFNQISVWLEMIFPDWDICRGGERSWDEAHPLNIPHVITGRCTVYCTLHCTHCTHTVNSSQSVSAAPKGRSSQVCDVSWHSVTVSESQ